MKLGRFVTLIVALFLAVVASACSAALPEQTSANREDAASTLSSLNSAKAVVLKKDAMSIGDHWSIKVEGKEIAVIEGLDLKGLGDTYSVLTPGGSFMGGEDEDIFNAAKTANFYDLEQKPTGQLTKELLSFGAKYNLKDTDGNTVARLEQKFGLTFKGIIKDGEGNEVWSLGRKAMAMSPEVTLTRQSDSTKVSALDAILMAVVASEIYDAENE